MTLTRPIFITSVRLVDFLRKGGGGRVSWRVWVWEVRAWGVIGKTIKV